MIKCAAEAKTTPDIFLKVLLEAECKSGPPRTMEQQNDFARPNPATFRSQVDGQMWRVFFYHDGGVCSVIRVEGD